MHSAEAGAGSRDALPGMGQTETKPFLGFDRPSHAFGAWCEEASRDDDGTQSDLELSQGRM